MGATKKQLYINHDLIMKKISDIENSRILLDKIAKMSINVFLKDEIIISGAKYQLILAIEAAQSICNHLAARVAKEAPSSYADCFRILSENQIISNELTAKLSAMAKFRNLLVHQYGQIDDSMVYNILNNDVGDFALYIDELKSYLLKVI